MDYRQLTYFLAVCDTHNMTVAAEREHVSQQALSKAIANLERELGVRLFERKSRGVELTGDGHVLQAEAAAYVRQHEELLDRFRAGRCLRPRVGIAIATGLLAQWFRPHVLSDYILKNPRLDVDVSFYSEDNYNRPRQSGAFDLVVSTRPAVAPWEERFGVHRRMRLLMAADCPLARKATLVLGDLAGSSIAVAIEDTPGQTEMIERFATVGCVPAVRFGPAEIPFVNHMLAAGRLLVPFGGPDVDVPHGAVMREVEGLDVRWSLYVLARADLPLSGPARDLLTVLRQGLRTNA